jgi:glutamine synthetase
MRACTFRRAATLSEEEKMGLGIKALPSTLAEALKAARADTEYLDTLKEGFGSEDLVRAHLAVRQSEWEYFSTRGYEHEVTTLYARY